MILRLPAHARTVREARHIDEVWTEEALKSPDWTESDPRDCDIIRAFKSIEEFGGGL
jgi:hypothetical protein